MGLLPRLACASLLLAMPAAADVPAWPQYGGPGRNFVVPAPKAESAGKPLVWRQKLGQGTSGIVSDGKSLFTMYSVPDAKAKSQGEEVVVALDPATGKVRWEHRYPVARLKGQQTFSGDPIRPQATPAVCQGKVCALGYTGLLTCFDAETGRVAWQRDLVKDYDAKPVQFGFSASPLVYQNRFVVHVGGKRSALMAFAPADGAVAWEAEPAEPSYASPVLFRVGDEEQLVQVTRDAVLGLAAGTGKTRWTYPLPKVGLTNVPTPIALSDGRLLVSGQGVLGTRLLKVSPKGGAFDVAEAWANEKVPYFYCTWLVEGERVVGNSGGFLTALDLATGKELWKKRGQDNSNQLRLGAETLALRGDGLLTRGTLTATGLETRGTYKLLDGRCWAAPTVLGDVVVARDDADIAAVRLSGIVKK